MNDRGIAAPDRWFLEEWRLWSSVDPASMTSLHAEWQWGEVRLGNVQIKTAVDRGLIAPTDVPGMTVLSSVCSLLANDLPTQLKLAALYREDWDPALTRHPLRVHNPYTGEVVLL